MIGNDIKEINLVEQLFMENERQAYLVTRLLKDNMKDIKEMPEDQWN